MASHSEPSPPPSPRRDKPATGHARSTGTLAHLQSYQLTQDVGDLVGEYAPAIVTSTITSGANMASSLIPSKVLSKADALTDSLLAQLDHTFPSLPELPLARFTAPPKRLVERTIINPVSAVNTTTRVYSRNLREKVSRIYSDNIVPQLAGLTDPYLHPINERISHNLDSSVPKSCGGAPTEGSSENAQERPEFEKTLGLFRTAVSHARQRVLVPFIKQAEHTKEDVSEGGDQLKEEIKRYPTRIRDGAGYIRQVIREETEAERKNGLVSTGVKISERVAEEAVSGGIMLTAKGVGVIWGVVDFGRGKLGI